jgi:AraC family transcriptional regulator of adaptative response/methylated-DNA-[protein]-cysteine methyltransferase
MHALSTRNSGTAFFRDSRFIDDEARWAAIRRRDPAADGEFVFAVSTTGVYCRSTCAARPARRENVSFHATPVSPVQTLPSRSSIPRRA